MITVFEAPARRELSARLEQLNVDSPALWGKMNVAQMLRHCRLWEEMIHENKVYPRPLIGRLIGPLVMKSVLRKTELARNTPTLPEMRISDTKIDFNAERQRLLIFVGRYAADDLEDDRFIHPFFGKMSREQIGRMAYMHLDHHLRQFGR